MDLVTIIVALIGLFGSLVTGVTSLLSQRSAGVLLQQLAPYAAVSNQDAVRFASILIRRMERSWSRRASRIILGVASASTAAGAILGLLVASDVFGTSLQDIVFETAAVLYFGGLLVGTAAALRYFRT